MITTPIKIETAAMPGIIEIPPPKMAKHLKMQLPEELLPKVWRVSESDLEVIIPASIRILKKVKPNISENALISYVRGNLMNNKARIVRTEFAWGMCEIGRLFCEDFLSGEIKFVCKLENSAVDKVAIYEDLKTWAKSVGAKKLIYNSLCEETDIEAIAKRIGYSNKLIGYVLEF
jgi:hypothetical protein